MRPRWRKALRSWALSMHELKLGNVEFFWCGHSLHSWGAGFHNRKTGRFVRLGNNGNGHEELDDVGLHLTLTIKRPGKEYRGGANGTSGGDRGNAGSTAARA